MLDKNVYHAWKKFLQNNISWIICLICLIITKHILTHQNFIRNYNKVDEIYMLCDKKVKKEPANSKEWELHKSSLVGLVKIEPQRP